MMVGMLPKVAAAVMLEVEDGAGTVVVFGANLVLLLL